SERANQSLQQLSGALNQLDPDEEDVRPAAGDVFPEEDKTAWSHKTQSEAGESLLLCQFAKVRLDGRSSLPAFRDLVPMNYDQSEYIQHLEAEVKFCKEELQGLKQRIRVVVVENEKLQSELKSRIADQSLKDYPIHNSMLGGSTHLSQVSLMHHKEECSIFALIISFDLFIRFASVNRKDLSVSQKECEEVKVRLRHKEQQVAEALKADGAARVAGLCLQCAQHEAVVAGTHANLHVQAIDRLTKERDELLAALRAMRASQQEAQQREWSACLQVKQAVEIAEEANLQKTRVCMDLRYQLSNASLKKEEAERELRELKAKTSRQKEKAAQFLPELEAGVYKRLVFKRKNRLTSSFRSFPPVGEMENLMGSQNSLIGKLKEECCKLGAKLEELSHQSRSVWDKTLPQAEGRLTLRVCREDDAEDVCVRQGLQMKRLQQLDRHCQSSAQQVCELLAKQSQLMQERNALSEEMQNLRIEVHTRTHTHDELITN
uniref:SHH signaling and ciliogenesis regulator sdccag8 n=1 Tax=Xiphophorus couchianus TaxID=32473 RepID=A0A3B5M2V5_9TELE